MYLQPERPKNVTTPQTLATAPTRTVFGCVVDISFQLVSEIHLYRSKMTLSRNMLSRFKREKYCLKYIPIYLEGRRDGRREWGTEGWKERRQKGKKKKQVEDIYTQIWACFSTCLYCYWISKLSKYPKYIAFIFYGYLPPYTYS